jgi:thiol-disulfide isomerase/thioredoxin
MHPLTRFAAAFAILASAAAGGYFAYRWAAHTDAGASTAGGLIDAKARDSRIDGATAEPVPKPVPEMLPDFVLADRQGKPRRLSDWKGRPLLVNFWATWCAPCRREIPLLQALRRERAADGIEVVGIAVDFRDAVLTYAADIGIDYPLLIGENDGLAAVDAFGMQMVFPFTVFADREHRIVALKIGELHRDEAEFILDRQREIDAGRLDVEAARGQIAAKLRELAAARATRQAGSAQIGSKDTQTPPN